MLTFCISQVFYFYLVELAVLLWPTGQQAVYAYAGVIHMSESDSFRNFPLSALADQGAGSPSGKPYEWQLDADEEPQMLALSPEAMVRRVFAKSERFRTVLERTAAYFVVVSRNNGYEGRDPRIITEGVRCGAVSDFLGIEIGLLGRALVEMQRRGIVSPTEGGNLRLEDLAALDRLSEGRLSA